MALSRLDQFIILMLVMLIPQHTVSSEKCTNPLPGLMQMASGVDITALDLFPIGDSTNARGFAENVFNFTCSGRTLAYLNFHYNQDFPDQLTHIGMDLGAAGDEIAFMSEMTSVKRTLMARLGLEYNDSESLGAFSQNTKYTSLLKQHFDISEHNIVFADIGTFGFTFRPYIIVKSSDLNYYAAKSILSHDFLDFTTHKLPPKYEDNQTVYQAFVQRFGTHYFERAILSNANYVQFALNRDYWFDSSDEKLGDNIRVAYNDYFKRWDSITETHIKYDLVDRKVFSNVSEIVLTYSALKNGSWWENKLTGTVHVSKQFKDMSIRRAVLKPIEDLIANETIQTQVAIAVRMHRIKAQLQELTNIYKFACNYYQLSSEEKVALDKVDKLVYSGDNKQADQMVNIISELYNKVLMARESVFYDQVIDDLYVTASAKLEFAKQICALSFESFLRGKILLQCPSDAIRDGEKKVSELYHRLHNGSQSVDYCKYRDSFEQSRMLNVEFGLRADITNGLKANCGYCVD